MLNCKACGTPNGTNGIVRYNISVDDGNNWNNDMGGQSFYGNTLLKTQAQSFGFGQISGFDNIYYEGKVTADNPTCANGPCMYNLLYNVNDGGEEGDVDGNPLFFSAGDVPSGGIGAANGANGNLLGFELNIGSPGISAGTALPSDGLPLMDFFGDTISSTSSQNMGAYDGMGGSSLNLLGNPGLESGVLSPWGDFNAVSVTTANPRSGKYALLVGPGTASSQQVISGLSPNTTYTFGGYGFVAGNGQVATFGVKAYDSTGNQEQQTITSSSYAPGFATFTTGSSNTTTIVYFYEPSGTGTIEGGDFFLVKEILANPGLEEGILGAWNVWNSVATTARPVHSGSYALEVGSAPSSSEQYISGLVPNTNYVFSGWAEVSAFGDVGMLGAKAFDSVGTQDDREMTSTSWTFAQVNFTTSPTNTTATVFCYNASGDGNLYCDDMAVNLNLLDNPGFESGASGMPVGPFANGYGPALMGAWIPTGGTGLAYENSNVRSGLFAVQFNGYPSTVHQTVCGLYPNTTYNFSSWGMVSASGNALQLTAGGYDGSATVSSSTITTTSYSPTYLTFTTGPTNTCATVTASQSSGSGTAYMDDVALTVASPE